MFIRIDTMVATARAETMCGYLMSFGACGAGCWVNGELVGSFLASKANHQGTNNRVLKQELQQQHISTNIIRCSM